MERSALLFKVKEEEEYLCVTVYADACYDYGSMNVFFSAYIHIEGRESSVR